MTLDTGKKMLVFRSSIKRFIVFICNRVLIFLCDDAFRFCFETAKELLNQEAIKKRKYFPDKFRQPLVILAPPRALPLVALADEAAAALLGHVIAALAVLKLLAEARRAPLAYDTDNNLASF